MESEGEIIMQYYLSNTDDVLSFKVEGMHDLAPGDVPVSHEIHEQYFQTSITKQVTLKNINGASFEEIFQVDDRVYKEG